MSIHGGIGLTTTSYNEKAAERGNTVSRGFGVQGIFEPRLYNVIGMPVTIGWEYLGPICFGTDTSAECSRRNERRTSLLFGSVGVSFYGPSLPLGLDETSSSARPSILAGHEWVSKGIGDGGCVNCTIDEVRFEGGLFLEPGLELPAGRHLMFGIGYRIYAGASDLENRFVIRFTSGNRDPL